MPFEKVQKNLGFGCMRLKMTDGQVDYGEFNQMIDAFLEAGFNYFDTAHGYIDGKSETAIRDCLVARHNRESFVLANKISDWFFEKEEDILPLFETQLKQCGVDYFDFYLFHCLTARSYPKHLACNSFSIIQKLKEQGKIKHIAMSFHDTADVLDRILTEQPCIEAVQLQFNYLDYDAPGVQSKACYDVAVKHGKKVIVMEPVKGGYLANLPPKAAQMFAELKGGSQAAYALRFAASFPQVFMVLSGMGDMTMMQDNLNTFSDFKPFTEAEFQVAHHAREVIRVERQVQCTKCNYCADVCPKKIPISEIFSVYNRFLAAKITSRQAKEEYPASPGAADCVACGKCGEVCPQNIDIKGYLQKIAKF